jgi:flagellar motor switch protein FliN/FliY
MAEEPPVATGEQDADNTQAISSADAIPAVDPIAEPPSAPAAVAKAPTAVAETPAAVADVPAAIADAAISDEQKAIDDLLKQATFEDPHALTESLPPTSNLDLPTFNQIAQEATTSSIDLLRDVDLNVKIELGRSQMLVEDVLKLGEGSVVELDKLAGDPVDVFVNERLVARGEVLVLNDNFCVRINEIVAGVKEEGL